MGAESIGAPEWKRQAHVSGKNPIAAENVAERDRLWVGRVLQGEVNAFAALVEAYQWPVFNLAYRMLGDRNEAEDAAQEAFLRVYRHLDRYDAERPFKTWLLSVASNYCIDRLRRRRLVWLSLDEPLPPHPALTSHAPDPEEMAMCGERSAQVQRLLAKLSPDNRLVVILRYWYGYSYAEIAEVLQTTESAVKSRLFRARRALAEMIGPRPAGRLMPAMEGS
jgi:RNA polymerase sigma-70 factor (ECF subfamily)